MQSFPLTRAGVLWPQIVRESVSQEPHVWLIGAIAPGASCFLAQLCVHLGGEKGGESQKCIPWLEHSRISAGAMRRLMVGENSARSQVLCNRKDTL